MTHSALIAPERGGELLMEGQHCVCDGVLRREVHPIAARERHRFRFVHDLSLSAAALFAASTLV